MSIPPSDIDLSCEDMRSVVQGISETQRKLQEIEKKLAKMGITI